MLQRNDDLSKLLVINKLDNVGIDLDSGHKYALRNIQAGENVIKYGQPIGHTTADVAVGEHIHSHNMKTNLSGKLEYTYTPGEVMDEMQKNRFLILFNPESDLYGLGWQQWRARLAMANGGFWGQGYMQGEIVQSNQLPKGYNDFIFASAGEELGMLGLLAIILLLSAICVRLLIIAHRAKDKAGAVICTGVFGMLAAQNVPPVMFPGSAFHGTTERTTMHEDARFTARGGSDHETDSF